jgi:hypothetical protein
MRALGLLAWYRGGRRHGTRDSVRARAAADGAIDEGIAVVGDPRAEAAWARFAARPVRTPPEPPARDDVAASCATSDSRIRFARGRRTG